MPDYRESNPYQAELSAALDREGVDVTTRSGRGLLAPVTRTVLAAGRPPVLHLHFVAPYMVVGDDRLESLGLAGPLSVLLGLRLLVDLVVASLLVDRLVWTAHDLRNHSGRAVRTELALKHVLVRWLCDAVVVHCDRAKGLLRETFRLPPGVEARMTTVPHGHFLDDYPDETTRSEARERLGLPQEATVVAFFGWIRRYKNVPDLIETFAGIDRPDARLVVAGNPRTDALAREVRAAAADDDRVTTTLEFVPDDEVQTYMRAADLVALPFETADQSLLTSGSVLLAMGFARPVLAPTLGCVGELLSAGGSGTAQTAGDPTSSGAGRGETGSQSPGRARTDGVGGDGRPGAGTGVRLAAGGVLYDSSDQLDAALRTALTANLDGCGARNRNYVEALDWDGVAARTAALYRA
jgi:glycosyltransferase involved in cell wall biosynthesis